MFDTTSSLYGLIAFTKLLAIRYRMRHAFDRWNSWIARSNPFSVHVRSRLCVFVALHASRMRWVDTPSNPEYHTLTSSILSEVNSEL